MNTEITAPRELRSQLSKTISALTHESTDLSMELNRKWSGVMDDVHDKVKATLKEIDFQSEGIKRYISDGKMERLGVRILADDVIERIDGIYISSRNIPHEKKDMDRIAIPISKYIDELVGGVTCLSEYSVAVRLSSHNDRQKDIGAIKEEIALINDMIEHALETTNRLNAHSRALTTLRGIGNLYLGSTVVEKLSIIQERADAYVEKKNSGG